MNATMEGLADNLLMTAKCYLGAEGSTPSPASRKLLYDAVVAIENACVKDGLFQWENAGRAE